MLGIPVKLSETPGARRECASEIRRAQPRDSQGLGFGDEEIATLEKAGVIAN
jgi:hypothetical protein